MDGSEFAKIVTAIANGEFGRTGREVANMADSIERKTALEYLIIEIESATLSWAKVHFRSGGVIDPKNIN